VRKRKPLEPLTTWEADAWALWDRIEKAVASDYSRWTAAANEAFLKLLYLDLKTRLEWPVAYNIARSYWLTARGRDHEVRADEALWIASKLSIKTAMKESLRQQQKANLKEWRAKQRAAAKAAKKEKA
jgi:hypothetical protein